VHETGLLQPVINGIVAHATREGAVAVSKVRLKLGMLCGITETAAQETFKLLTKGTLLDGAELELTVFPGSGIQVISFDIE
jgi:Zn finger protein HypA/HybF involved in hydrogenase expression